MANKSITPIKRNPMRRNFPSFNNQRNIQEHNESSKSSEIQKARNFVSWYKHMVDYNRPNLGLYVTDDIVLEWFGKTIKTRKKVSAFLKFDMQCSRHDFTTVETIEQIQTRDDHTERNTAKSHDDNLASPLDSPETIKPKCKIKTTSNSSRKRSRHNFSSFESDTIPEKQKCFKGNDKYNSLKADDHIQGDGSAKVDNFKRSHSDDDGEILNKGDGESTKKLKRKCLMVTPPNCEQGQGDCMPSTSGTNSALSHASLNGQLLKRCVECNGYIEFTRARNCSSTDSVKWERKCKLQICYSEDPLNIGEYIIWAIHYTDESKCRRNLLAAFEEVANEELKKT